MEGVHGRVMGVCVCVSKDHHPKPGVGGYDDEVILAITSLFTPPSNTPEPVYF